MEYIVRYHLDQCKPGLGQKLHADVGKPAKADSVNIEGLKSLEHWRSVDFGAGLPDPKKFMLD